MGMQLHFSNPELQTKVEQWVSETGRPVEELVEALTAAFGDEQAPVAGGPLGVPVARLGARVVRRADGIV